MAKIDLMDPNWVNMVFASRNKEYGAYRLRLGTGSRNLWAIIIMLALAAAIAGVIGVNKIVEANKPKVAVTSGVDLSALAKQKRKLRLRRNLNLSSRRRKKWLRKLSLLSSSLLLSSSVMRMYVRRMK